MYMKCTGLEPFQLFGPLMWLSAANFDGAHPTGDQVIKGSASGRTKDSIGNAVTSAGTIQVEEALGHSAYHFKAGSAITSPTPVSTMFTLATVFRRKMLKDEGRFFNGSEGNYMFASDHDKLGEFYLDGYATSGYKSTTEIECYIATNENGVKNMWDVRENRQIATNSRAGANNWGSTIIGSPPGTNSAEDVSLYEALVYQYVLNAQQIEQLKTFFRDKYRIFSTHASPFVFPSPLAFQFPHQQFRDFKFLLSQII